MTGQGEPTEIEQGPTRRDALKKVGVGAAIAWSLPVVASSPAFAVGSDAPYPPGSCPSCAQNLVLNPQFDSGTANWTGSGGSIRTYASSPVLSPFSPADQPVYLRINHQTSYRQVVSIAGGCSSLPYLFSLHGLARRGTLTAQLDFFRNNLSSPVGTPQTLTLTSSGQPLTFSSLATAGGVTLPAVNLADTILARITLSFTSALSDFGGADAVSLTIGC